MSSSGLLQTFFEIRAALYRFVIVRGATEAEAEDILQEMSVKLATEKVGPVAEPRAYLYKMASNHFQLHRRTEQRRTRREAHWVDAHSGVEKEVDPQASAEQTLIHREQLSLLRAVLGRLPERTRWIFDRFRIDGEPQRQIAQELGVSVSAVEKHLSKAYQEIASVRGLMDADQPLPRHLTREKGQHEH